MESNEVFEMTTKDEALEMAIEALNNACIKIEKWTKGGKWTAGKEALAKCKEALKHQEVGDAEIKQMLNDIEYYQKRVEALEQPAQAITEGSQLSNIKAGSQSEKPSPPPAPKHTCTYSRTINQEYPRKCIHCGEVEALEQPSVAQLNNEYLRDTHVDGLEQPAQEPVAWISVKDKLPNTDGKYIVYGDCTNDGYQHDMAVFSESKFCKYNQPTHWMQLPKTPNETNTHPAPSWQVLSDDEINSFYEKIKWNVDIKDIVIDFARAIEQALKQKNT